jgi:hypothetical protein
MLLCAKTAVRHRQGRFSMTAAELIALLEGLDPDAPVLVVVEDVAHEISHVEPAISDDEEEEVHLILET